jgi:hypothetical protein
MSLVSIASLRRKWSRTNTMLAMIAFMKRIDPTSPRRTGSKSADHLVREGNVCARSRGSEVQVR